MIRLFPKPKIENFPPEKSMRLLRIEAATSTIVTSGTLYTHWQFPSSVMNPLNENPRERPLTEKQLDQATDHTWYREMKYGGIMGIPLAAVSAFMGNIPLAVGLGATSVISLGLVALRKRTSQKEH